MKNLLRVIVFVWCAAAGLAANAQQEKKVLVLHPKVGEEIDKQEKARFGLFPFLKTADYVTGRFVQLPDSSVVLEATMANGSLVNTPYTWQNFWGTQQLLGPTGDAPTTPPAAKPAADEKVYMIETKDGSVLYGKLVRSDAASVEIETDNLGKITLQRSQIKEMKEATVSTSSTGPKYWFPNPHATRLFYAPTAFMLKRGEGYFLNTYIFLNSVQIGITDNFTMGGGLTILPGLELSEQLLFLNPKIGGQLSERTGLAGGLLFMSVFDTQFGLGYGVFTMGKPDLNLNVGMGLGFFDGQVSSRPATMVGGVARVTRRLAFISENYFVFTQSGLDETYELQPIGSFGIRLMGEKVSGDLAWVVLGLNEGVPPLPLLNFAFKF